MSTVERIRHRSPSDRSRQQVFRSKQEDTFEPRGRIFTPARVVALALIAVLVTGLAYVRFAPEPARSPCPKGRTPAT